MKTKKIKLSPTSTLHYLKLVYRTMLFLIAAVIYIYGRVKNNNVFDELDSLPWIMGVIWVIYAVEIALRFFPSKLESMGCQKQFTKNYIPTGETTPIIQSWKRTVAVAAVWLALNGAIGVLYYTKVIDAGILILISLAYAVCDMICILFFCPFQTWIMKNKCCTVCRIYNWDFPMMFTPLVFIPSLYTWSLLFLSLVLLVRWELSVHFHPERFSEKTNACLNCKNCTEKLCHHKKQLKSFIKNNRFHRR
ncbi:MAG: hypothetical protein IJN75_04655 [Clostridia bacterium]|nr:hypothetical protein [Clostridia bacterium]